MVKHIMLYCVWGLVFYYFSNDVTSAVESRIRARVCSGYLPYVGVRDVADQTRRLVYVCLPNIDPQQPSFTAWIPLLTWNISRNSRR